MSKPEKKEINSSNLRLRSMPSAKPGEREKRRRCSHWTCLCTHHSPSGLWVSSFGPSRLPLWWADRMLTSYRGHWAPQSCNESLHLLPWPQEHNQAIKTRHWHWQDSKGNFFLKITEFLLDLVGSCSHITDFPPNNSSAQQPSACFCLAAIFFSMILMVILLYEVDATASQTTCHL